MDTLKSGQPPYNGQTVHPLSIYCPYISTSEEGTTAEQWTKCSSPMCPFLRGSTVLLLCSVKAGLLQVECGHGPSHYSQSEHHKEDGREDQGNGPSSKSLQQCSITTGRVVFPLTINELHLKL